VTEENQPAPHAAPALFLVKGDATPEEVAALTVVLQGVAATTAGPTEEPRVTSEWAARRRTVRSSHAARRGGWRSSALPH
jgi:hypothetical protein